MSDNAQSQNNLIVDIWTSYQALPGWVKIWTMLILVPINMLSLLFINEPMGGWVALLAISAMLLNIPVLFYTRGFSKLLALPHVIPWTLLVGLLLFARPEATGVYAVYLWILLAVDLVSLLFDYTDTWQWFNGNREVIGHQAQSSQ